MLASDQEMRTLALRDLASSGIRHLGLRYLHHGSLKHFNKEYDCVDLLSRYITTLGIAQISVHQDMRCRSENEGC